MKLLEVTIVGIIVGTLSAISLGHYSRIHADEVEAKAMIREYAINKAEKKLSMTDRAVPLPRSTRFVFSRTPIFNGASPDGEVLIAKGRKNPSKVYVRIADGGQIKNICKTLMPCLR